MSEVDVLDLEEGEVVATVSDEGVDVHEEYFAESVAGLLHEVTHLNPTGPGEYEEILLGPGDTGFARAFVDEIPSPFDAADLNKLNELSEPDRFQKEWVPFQGPRGGQGWRSTVTGQVRYQENKPVDSSAPDVDEITWDDVMDAEIQQIKVWSPITNPDELQRGMEVQYADPNEEHTWEAYVEEVTENQVTLETDSLRQVEVPVEDGKIQGDMRRQTQSFLGNGIAGSNDKWLPEEGEPNEEQLFAEAVRSAAATDGLEDIDPLVTFVGTVNQRGVDVSDIRDAVEVAIEKHPILQEDKIDEIVEQGLSQDPDVEEEHELETDNATPVIEAMYKQGEWIPYEGPQGGQGWLSTDTDEVIYQDEPPGPLDTDLLDEVDSQALREELEERGLDPDEILGEGDFPDEEGDESEEPERGTVEELVDEDEEIAPIAEVELEGGTELIFGALEDAEKVEVDEAVNDPTAIMGPAAGHLKLSDGTYATLTGEMNDSLPPEALEDGIRALTDADAIRDALPEPTGSEDPSDWKVDWQSADVRFEDQEGERDLLRLPEREKEMFMEEWKAAAPEEGVREVSSIMTNFKNTTFNTNGQKFDKLAKAAFGLEGEPRSNGFDEAEEPTEEEIEAFEIYAEASREFVRQNFGEEPEIHRGLGAHAEEPVLEVLGQQISTGEVGEEIKLRDNPAATFTLDKKMSNSYGHFQVDVNVDVEEIFSAPEALIDMSNAFTDWNEGEVNLDGWNREITPDSIRVGGTDVTVDQLLENPVETFESEYDGQSALQTFARMLSQYDAADVAEQLHEKILESDEVARDRRANSEEWNSVLDSLVEARGAEIMAQDSAYIVDVRDGEDWLRKSREERDVQKSEWVPYTGPRGGEGWKNPDSGEIIYQPEPPGQVSALEDQADPRLVIDPEDIEADDYISIDGEIEGIVEMVDMVGGEARVTMDDGRTIRVDDTNEIAVDDEVDTGAYRRMRDVRQDVYERVQEIPIKDWPNGAYMSQDEIRNNTSAMLNRSDSEVREKFFEDIEELLDRASRSGYNLDGGQMQFRPDAMNETLMHEVGHALLGSAGYDVTPEANGFAYFYSGEIPDFEEGEPLDEVFIRMVDEKIEKLTAHHPALVDYDMVDHLKQKKEEARQRFGGQEVQMDMFYLDARDDAIESEEVETLVEELNEAWKRQVDAHRDEELDESEYVIGEDYSATNAHETFAMLNEELQGDTADPNTMEVLLLNHGSLLEAYLELFEPRDIQKEVMNQVHRINPNRSHFPEDEVPFPEVDNR